MSVRGTHVPPHLRLPIAGVTPPPTEKDGQRLFPTGNFRFFRPVYRDKMPPCNNACPTGEQIQKYLDFVKHDRFLDGYLTICEDNFMPSITGRVCYHPCETACNRAEHDEPIGIRSVERFLGDFGLQLPKEIDPLHWQQHATRDLKNNPIALRHYHLGQMWRTPQAKWIGIQYALFIGCSLFGVAYYYSFAEAMGLGSIAAAVGFAGFSLADGVCRPIYGYISEFIGRRRTMIYAYSGNVVFQLLALWAGELHNAPFFVLCAVISGGLSGANFPMTAALVADYYGETNNALNYGSIYAFKALGGSFAGGLAALIMTGTLYGSAKFAWPAGFFFGAALGALAAVTVTFLCKRPTEQQMETAVRKAADKEEQRAKPAMA